MNRQSVSTCVLSMMTVVALLIMTVSPVSADCIAVNQIHDRQELAAYHGGSQSLGDCTTLNLKSYDQINSRSDLAEYQAAVASQAVFVSETITVAKQNPFDQIEDRAELAEYQSFIATQPILYNEENNMIVLK